MKKLSMLLMLVLVVSLFAGCGGDEEPADTGNGNAATDNGSDDGATDDGATDDGAADAGDTGSSEPLQMAWFSDGIEGDVMQSIIDDFTAETGIVIEMNTLAYDDYLTKIKTNIRGGEAPALMRATEGHIAELNAELLGLDSAFNAADFTNVYYNAAGEVVSLPMDVTSNGLYVNTDLLDQYGVNYPSVGETWTWEEFETEMSKLVGQDDVAYPGVFDNKAHRFFPMVYQFGGKIWNTPYTDSALTEDAAVNALATLQRFNSSELLDPAVWAGTANAGEMFKTGQYGFHMSGNWMVAGYQELSFNWAVVPMPTGDGSTRSTILGGKGMVALKNSGFEDEALQFIEYLAKAENHDKYTGGVPFLSPRLAADLDFGEFQAAYSVFQDEIANTPVASVEDWQAQVAISGMYPIINEAVENCMGGQDPAATMEQLAQDLMDLAAELGLE